VLLLIVLALNALVAVLRRWRLAHADLPTALGSAQA
jgi:hypothetical protein